MPNERAEAKIRVAFYQVFVVVLMTQATQSFGGLGFFVALALCLLNLLTLCRLWLKALQATTPLGTAAVLFPSLDGAPLHPATLAVNWTLVGGVVIGSAVMLGLVLAVFGLHSSASTHDNSASSPQWQPGTAVAAVEPTRNEE